MSEASTGIFVDCPDRCGRQVEVKKTKNQKLILWCHGDGKGASGCGMRHTFGGPAAKKLWSKIDGNKDESATEETGTSDAGTGADDTGTDTGGNDGTGDLARRRKRKRKYL